MGISGVAFLSSLSIIMLLTRYVGSEAITTYLPWCETLKFQFFSSGETKPSPSLIAFTTPAKNGLLCC